MQSDGCVRKNIQIIEDPDNQVRITEDALYSVFVIALKIVNAIELM